MAKYTYHGPAKPDDPIYSSGVVVGGERLSRSRKNSPNKDNVVSRDVMDLKRAVKIVSAEMNAAMERQGSQED